MAQYDELLAAAQARVAARAAASPAAAGSAPIVPLWKVAPKNKWTEKVNPGEFGDGLVSPGGGRVTGGRAVVDLTREVLTPDGAATKFLEMDDADREEFKNLAIQSGILKVGEDGYVSQDETFNAWEKATRYAASWNGERDKEKWISPWEAARKLALQNKAGNGGAYDAFKPRTSTSIRRMDFTSGETLGNVAGTMREMFKAEMGREPTEAEVRTYSKMLQTAYDANPEKTTSTTTVDKDGNQSTEQQISGGIDVGETLLNQVRDDPERDAFQAGSTFFQAAMSALGAIA